MLIATSVILALSLLPAVLFLRNLHLFQPPESAPALSRPSVSILIPARNEESRIAPILESALAQEEVDLEILVLDDHSEDRTAEIIDRFSKDDSRIRRLPGQPLPPDWGGKMFACWQLAQEATHDWMLFLDADVEISTDSVRRVIDHARTSPVKPALVSGIPRQRIGSWSEALLIPLIPFVMLGYLPLARLRRFPNPEYAAAVGQYMLVDRVRYLESGGHSKIKTTFHDGLGLPATLRRSGHFTDLVDITHLAASRMYTSFPEVWSGLLKNAGEGLGSPRVILPMTVLLIGGQVLPWLMLPLTQGSSQLILAFACFLTLIPRIAGKRRFHQPAWSVLVHPIGVLLLEIIQWCGFFLRIFSIPTTWKGRAKTP